MPIFRSRADVALPIRHDAAARSLYASAIIFSLARYHGYADFTRLLLAEIIASFTLTLFRALCADIFRRYAALPLPRYYAFAAAMPLSL